MPSKDEMAQATNYQAGIIAVQLFLQHYVTREPHVSCDTILKFYLRNCKGTVADFLAFRAVRFHHEDDERDGSEDETPLTCERAQEVFEHVERFLRTKYGEAALNQEDPRGEMNAAVFDTPRFTAIVEKQYAAIRNSYDKAVDAAMIELFHPNTSDVPMDFMRRVAQYIVRASVLSTDDFYQRFSDEEKTDGIDTFKVDMDGNCEIVRVAFETFDDLDHALLFTDPEMFADRYVVMKTDNDSRLRSFYYSAAEYMNEAVDLYGELEKQGLLKRASV